MGDDIKKTGGASHIPHPQSDIHESDEGGTTPSDAHDAVDTYVAASATTPPPSLLSRKMIDAQLKEQGMTLHREHPYMSVNEYDCYRILQYAYDTLVDDLFPKVRTRFVEGEPPSGKKFDALIERSLVMGYAGQMQVTQKEAKGRISSFRETYVTFIRENLARLGLTGTGKPTSSSQPSTAHASTSTLTPATLATFILHARAQIGAIEALLRELADEDRVAGEEALSRAQRVEAEHLRPLGYDEAQIVGNLSRGNHRKERAQTIADKTRIIGDLFFDVRAQHTRETRPIDIDRVDTLIDAETGTGKKRRSMRDDLEAWIAQHIDNPEAAERLRTAAVMAIGWGMGATQPDQLPRLTLSSERIEDAAFIATERIADPDQRRDARDALAQQLLSALAHIALRAGRRQLLTADTDTRAAKPTVHARRSEHRLTLATDSARGIRFIPSVSGGMNELIEAIEEKIGPIDADRFEQITDIKLSIFRGYGQLRTQRTASRDNWATVVELHQGETWPKLVAIAEENGTLEELLTRFPPANSNDARWKQRLHDARGDDTLIDLATGYTPAAFVLKGGLRRMLEAYLPKKADVRKRMQREIDEYEKAGLLGENALETMPTAFTPSDWELLIAHAVAADELEKLTVEPKQRDADEKLLIAFIHLGTLARNRGFELDPVDFAAALSPIIRSMRDHADTEGTIIVPVPKFMGDLEYTNYGTPTFASRMKGIETAMPEATRQNQAGGHVQRASWLSLDRINSSLAGRDVSESDDQIRSHKQFNGGFMRWIELLMGTIPDIRDAAGRRIDLEGITSRSRYRFQLVPNAAEYATDANESRTTQSAPRLLADAHRGYYGKLLEKADGYLAAVEALPFPVTVTRPAHHGMDAQTNTPIDRPEEEISPAQLRSEIAELILQEEIHRDRLEQGGASAQSDAQTIAFYRRIGRFAREIFYHLPIRGVAAIDGFDIPFQAVAKLARQRLRPEHAGRTTLVIDDIFEAAHAQGWSATRRNALIRLRLLMGLARREGRLTPNIVHAGEIVEALRPIWEAPEHLLEQAALDFIALGQRVPLDDAGQALATIIGRGRQAPSAGPHEPNLPGHAETWDVQFRQFAAERDADSAMIEAGLAAIRTYFATTHGFASHFWSARLDSAVHAAAHEQDVDPIALRALICESFGRMGIANGKPVDGLHIIDPNSPEHAVRTRLAEIAVSAYMGLFAHDPKLILKVPVQEELITDVVRLTLEEYGQQLDHPPRPHLVARETRILLRRHNERAHIPHTRANNALPTTGLLETRLAHAATIWEAKHPDEKIDRTRTLDAVLAANRSRPSDENAEASALQSLSENDAHFVRHYLHQQREALADFEQLMADPEMGFAKRARKRFAAPNVTDQSLVAFAIAFARERLTSVSPTPARDIAFELVADDFLPFEAIAHRMTESLTGMLATTFSDMHEQMREEIDLARTAIEIEANDETVVVASFKAFIETVCSRNELGSWEDVQQRDRSWGLLADVAGIDAEGTSIEAFARRLYTEQVVPRFEKMQAEHAEKIERIDTAEEQAAILQNKIGMISAMYAMVPNTAAMNDKAIERAQKHLDRGARVLLRQTTAIKAMLETHSELEEIATQLDMSDLIDRVIAIEEKLVTATEEAKAVTARFEEHRVLLNKRADEIEQDKTEQEAIASAKKMAQHGATRALEIASAIADTTSQAAQAQIDSLQEAQAAFITAMETAQNAPTIPHMTAAGAALNDFLSIREKTDPLFDAATNTVTHALSQHAPHPNSASQLLTRLQTIDPATAGPHARTLAESITKLQDAIATAGTFITRMQEIRAIGVEPMYTDLRAIEARLPAMPPQLPEPGVISTEDDIILDDREVTISRTSTDPNASTRAQKRLAPILDARVLHTASQSFLLATQQHTRVQTWLSGMRDETLTAMDLFGNRITLDAHRWGFHLDNPASGIGAIGTDHPFHRIVNLLAAAVSTEDGTLLLLVELARKQLSGGVATDDLRNLLATLAIAPHPSSPADAHKTIRRWALARAERLAQVLGTKQNAIFVDTTPASEEAKHLPMLSPRERTIQARFSAHNTTHPHLGLMTIVTPKGTHEFLIDPEEVDANKARVDRREMRASNAVFHLYDPTDNREKEMSSEAMRAIGAWDEKNDVVITTPLQDDPVLWQKERLIWRIFVDPRLTKLAAIVHHQRKGTGPEGFNDFLERLLAPIAFADDETDTSLSLIAAQDIAVEQYERFQRRGYDLPEIVNADFNAIANLVRGWMRTNYQLTENDTEHLLDAARENPLLKRTLTQLMIMGAIIAQRKGLPPKISDRMCKHCSDLLSSFAEILIHAQPNQRSMRFNRALRRFPTDRLYREERQWIVDPEGLGLTAPLHGWIHPTYPDDAPWLMPTDSSALMRFPEIGRVGMERILIFYQEKEENAAAFPKGLVELAFIAPSLAGLFTIIATVHRRLPPEFETELKGIADAFSNALPRTKVEHKDTQTFTQQQRAIKQTVQKVLSLYQRHRAIILEALQRRDLMAYRTLGWWLTGTETPQNEVEQAIPERASLLQLPLLAHVAQPHPALLDILPEWGRPDLSLSKTNALIAQQERTTLPPTLQTAAQHVLTRTQAWPMAALAMLTRPLLSDALRTDLDSALRLSGAEAKTLVIANDPASLMHHDRIVARFAAVAKKHRDEIREILMRPASDTGIKGTQEQLQYAVIEDLLHEQSIFLPPSQLDAIESWTDTETLEQIENDLSALDFFFEEDGGTQDTRLSTTRRWLELQFTVIATSLKSGELPTEPLPVISTQVNELPPAMLHMALLVGINDTLGIHAQRWIDRIHDAELLDRDAGITDTIALAKEMYRFLIEERAHLHSSIQRRRLALHAHTAAEEMDDEVDETNRHRQLGIEAERILAHPSLSVLTLKTLQGTEQHLVDDDQFSRDMEALRTGEMKPGQFVLRTYDKRDDRWLEFPAHTIAMWGVNNIRSAARMPPLNDFPRFLASLRLAGRIGADRQLQTLGHFFSRQTEGALDERMISVIARLTNPIERTIGGNQPYPMTLANANAYMEEVQRLMPFGMISPAGRIQPKAMDAWLTTWIGAGSPLHQHLSATLQTDSILHEFVGMVIILDRIAQYVPTERLADADRRSIQTTVVQAKDALSKHFATSSAAEAEAFHPKGTNGDDLQRSARDAVVAAFWQHESLIDDLAMIKPLLTLTETVRVHKPGLLTLPHEALAEAHPETGRVNPFFITRSIRMMKKQGTKLDRLPFMIEVFPELAGMLTILWSVEDSLNASDLSQFNQISTRIHHQLFSHNTALLAENATATEAAELNTAFERSIEELVAYYKQVHPTVKHGLNIVEPNAGISVSFLLTGMERDPWQNPDELLTNDPQRHLALIMPEMFAVDPARSGHTMKMLAQVPYENDDSRRVRDLFQVVAQHSPAFASASLMTYLAFNTLLMENTKQAHRLFADPIRDHEATWKQDPIRTFVDLVLGKEQREAIREVMQRDSFQTGTTNLKTLTGLDSIWDAPLTIAQAKSKKSSGNSNPEGSSGANTPPEGTPPPQTPPTETGPLAAPRFADGIEASSIVYGGVLTDEPLVVAPIETAADAGMIAEFGGMDPTDLIAAPEELLEMGGADFMGDSSAFMMTSTAGAALAF